MATATLTTELIQERVAMGTGRVDRAAGVIRGVKILGTTSLNGRDYPPATLREAAGKYEGVKVNVNHPKGSALASRDYQDRIGHLQNVQARGDGLFADLRYNPKHAVAEQLAWDAEHAPENVGLSHNVEAKTSKKNGRVVVEAIVRVQSVDIVADPATTNGLFESTGTNEAEPADDRSFVDRLYDRRDPLALAAFVESLTGRPTKSNRDRVSQWVKSLRRS